MSSCTLYCLLRAASLWSVVVVVVVACGLCERRKHTPYSVTDNQQRKLGQVKVEEGQYNLGIDDMFRV